MMNSGIFSPRQEAEIPVPNDPWERTTSAIITPAQSPATSTTEPRPTSYASETRMRLPKITNKRAPRKTAGITSKRSHLQWLAQTGLPRQNEALAIAKADQLKTIQEKTDLEIQMNAIRAMQGKDAYETVSYTHLTLPTILRV